MRILVLSNMFPPHHLGGYELSCADVVVRWRSRGHRVGVLTTTMRLPDVKGNPDDEPDVRRDLEFYWRDHELVRPPFAQRLAIERRNQASFLQAVADWEPDVLSVWNMGAMSLGLLTSAVRRRLPVVLVVCDDWLVYGPRLDPWTWSFRRAGPLTPVLEALVRVPVSLPDLSTAVTACFVSDFTRRRAAQRSRWRPEVATVVPSGIDRKDFPPWSSPPPSQPWRWRLLYVGRLDHRKGLETLIAALSRMPPEATLHIAGRGEDAYRDRLVELARSSGVLARVRFGHHARAELRAVYRSADVLAFPSEWDEPFGLVPIEAMASGIPVVATATGGSCEFLVDGENCLLYGPGSPEALARAVARLAGDQALRERLIRGGLRTADGMTTDRLADDLESWHLRAVEGPPAAAPQAAQLHGCLGQSAPEKT